MATTAGRITRLFGTDGGVMLVLYDAFPEDFDPRTTPFLVTVEGLQVPLWCRRFERRGARGALACFEDLECESHVAELLGLEFRIETAAEAEQEEFRLEELLGFAVEARVEGEAEVRRATLVDFFDSDANPLFEVELEGRRALVPAAQEFIEGIDFDKRTMRMTLPEGLLDL